MRSSFASDDDEGDESGGGGDEKQEDDVPRSKGKSRRARDEDEEDEEDEGDDGEEEEEEDEGDSGKGASSRSVQHACRVAERLGFACLQRDEANGVGQEEESRQLSCGNLELLRHRRADVTERAVDARAPRIFD